AGAAIGVPGFAAGLLMKACWLGRSCCVGFFWIDSASWWTTFGTGVVAPTGLTLAAAATAAAGLPAATATGGLVIRVLVTVVLWMLVKMMLLGGGATKTGGWQNTGTGTNPG